MSKRLNEMKVIRGAVNLSEDTVSEVRDGVFELLDAVVENEPLKSCDIVLFLVSATPDIRSVYPCRYVREYGFDQVPLLCVQEMDIGDSMPMTIRFLIQVENAEGRDFIYIRDTVSLRGDSR